ncbi:hypothetical protein ACCS61_36065 [Rhizobium ruizarguesonis]
MSTELVTMVISFVVAVASGVFAYRDEKTRRKRLFQAFALGSTIVLGLAGFEIYYQEKNKEDRKAAVESVWNVVAASPIDHFEVDALIGDGVAEAGEFHKALARSTFSITGLKSADGLVASDMNVALDEGLKPENLGKAKRIGFGVATAVHNRLNNDTTVTGDVDCFASGRNVTRVSGDKTLICSVTATIPVSGNLTLADISRSSKLAIRVPTQLSAIKCMGACSQTFVSLRAVTKYSPSQLYSEAVEISPQSYMQVPNSATEAESEFILSGDALQKLAEQRFKDTYGYHDQGSFEFTLGLIHLLYAELTMTQDTGVIMDEVWTTASAPSAEALNIAAGATGPDLQQFQMREWCLFGSDKLCWQVYVVMDMSKKARGL